MIEETEEAREVGEAHTPPPMPAAGPIGPALPPPVRRIVVDSPPTLAAPTVSDRGVARAPRAAAGPERMTLDDLSVFYGPKAAVKDVSIAIRQGEVLALIGPSGCGKTTLLRTLNRLTELTPTARRAGSIALDGRDIDSLEVTELRLREQAMKRPGRAVLEPLVVDALQRAGLYDEVRDDLDRPALRLSGGQQQRLCIARAIATRPEVLLMDEPCSALDPRSTAVIEELIGQLRHELAIVIVTHNLQQAYRVGDRVAFMYLGDLVEYGPTEQVFGAPRAQRTRDYVGGAFG